MDKNRFLTSFDYFWSLALAGLAGLVVLWWFFIYVPLVNQAHLYDNLYQQATTTLKDYTTLDRQLLEEKRELLKLNRRKIQEELWSGFSLEHLSKGIMDAIAASGATVSFFRCKNWRERNDATLCEVDFSLQGSLQTILSFLHLMKERNARPKSCVIKKNDDARTLDLTATFTLVMNSHATSQQPSVPVARPQDFALRRDIFFGQRPQALFAEPPSLQQQVAHLKESPLQKPPLKVSRPIKRPPAQIRQSSYRPPKTQPPSGVV